MSRRIGVVIVAAWVTLLCAAPASALCNVVGLGRLLDEAQAVWWVSVTGTKMVDGGQYGEFPGGWTLSVQIRQVLKGPLTDESAQTVVMTSCGFAAYITSKEALQTFVGNDHLFIGNLTDGALFPFPVILAARRLSPHEQYEKALRLVGVSEASPSNEVSPQPPKEDLGTGVSPWSVTAVVAGIVVALAALTIWWRRRATAA